MLNFDQTLAATEAAYNSAGITAQQFGIYQESIEGKLEALRLQWQALVAEGGTINKFIKLILDAGTAVLKFANSDIGQLILKAGLLFGAFSMLNKITGGTLLTSLGGLGVKMFGLASAEGAATLGATGLATAMNAIPVIALITALGLLAVQIAKSIKTFDELKQEIQETDNAIQQLESEYDALSSKAPTELTNAEKERLGILKEQLEVLKEQKKEQQEQLYKSYKTPTITTGNTEMVGGGLGFKSERISIEEYIKTLDNLADAEDNAREKMAAHAQQLIEFRDAGIDLDESQKEFLNTYNALIEASQNATDSASDTTDAFAKLAQAEGSIADTNRAVISSLRAENAEMIKNWNSMQDLVAAETQLRNGQKLEEAQIQALIAKYPQLRTQIDAMRNGELAAANAIHAVGVQSLGTSKTIIANSKAEAQAVVKSAQAQVDAYNAAMVARLKAGGSGVTMSSGMAEAVALLNQAKAELAMYSQAEYYGTAVTTGNTSATSSNTSAKQEQTDATRELTDALKDEANALKDAADLMISKLDAEIDALEKQKDAIRDANDALEDQIELEEALDALARAKSKRVLVYKDGQFQYSTDTTAVGAAQKQLSETQRKQAQQAQIDAIDERIDAIKAEQESWRNVSKAYDDYLGKQELGLDKEAQNWQDRLGQAELFANKYLEIMKAVADVESGKLTIAQGKAIVSQAKNFSGTLPKSTSTLLDPMQASMASWSGLNSMASPSYSTLGSGVQVIQQFGDISLPNVTNANQFVEALKNFKQYAVQAASQR